MDSEEQQRREREKMMKRLYEASLSGNISSLIQLIEEDQLILDRVMIITYFNETPLHIVAMLGHLEFAREILRRKPELAAELDLESSSPLHLASAKGNLEIVKELLRINPDVCRVTNHDGRTPLHLAVIKNRIDVMKELIQTRPEVIHSKVDKGGSILHLCVKYDCLEALKQLLESAANQELELLNSKDDDGNTALHLAVAMKQTKGIELLLAKNGVEVNALNESGLTALDILAQAPRNMKDMDIGESLRAVGALRAKDIIILSALNNNNSVTTINGTNALFSSSNAHINSNNQMESTHKNEWLERKKNSLMVVSTVIATMAFQAVLSPPGGVWQDDNNHKAGTSILADKDHSRYTAFLIVNTISFLGSLSITLLLISGLPLKRRFFMWILMVSMWIVITSLVSTYVVSMLQVTPDGQFDMLTYILDISIRFWLGMVSLVVLLHTARWFLWYVNRLSLRMRIFMWIFALSVTITLSFTFVPPMYCTISIWCGMVSTIVLIYTARFVKKRWERLTTGRLAVNDQNQSSV